MRFESALIYAKNKPDILVTDNVLRSYPNRHLRQMMIPSVRWRMARQVSARFSSALALCESDRVNYGRVRPPSRPESGVVPDRLGFS